MATSNTGTITRPVVTVALGNSGSLLHTNKKITVQSEAVSGASRFSALTDVVTSNSSGIIVYNSNTQVYTVSATDGTVFYPTVNNGIANVNWSLGGVARITLASNVMIVSTGTRSKVLLQLTQNGSGNHIVSLDANTHSVGQLTPPYANYNPNVTSYIGMLYNEQTAKYDVVGLVTGY